MKQLQSGKKLKVLIISNGHPSPKAPYFYPFIAEQARALSSKIDCNIIVPIEILLPIKKHHQYIEFAQYFPDKLRLNGYDVLFPRAYRFFPGLNKYVADYLMLWTTIYAIWHYQIQFDIIHAHFAHPSGFIAAIISRLFKKPYVLTVHGSDVLENFVDKKNAHRRRRHRNIGLNRADRVICVSSHLKKKVIGHGMDEEKVVVIPNGIDVKVFAPPINNNGTYEIIFVGNLIELKGVDLLISAFHQISEKNANVHLKIVGDGYLKPKLSSLATELGIADRVDFFGPKENSAVAQIIPKAKLLCLPSRQEGFGVVLIEALACGVPVVGARTGGIVDIIHSEDIGFLFEPGDANDLALKLEAALHKKWDQTVIRQEGLKYSWDRIADQIIEQYQSVLDS